MTIDHDNKRRKKIFLAVSATLILLVISIAVGVTLYCKSHESKDTEEADTQRINFLTHTVEALKKEKRELEMTKILQATEKEEGSEKLSEVSEVCEKIREDSAVVDGKIAKIEEELKQTKKELEAAKTTDFKNKINKYKRINDFDFRKAEYNKETEMVAKEERLSLLKREINRMKPGEARNNKISVFDRINKDLGLIKRDIKIIKRVKLLRILHKEEKEIGKKSEKGMGDLRKEQIKKEIDQLERDDLSDTEEIHSCFGLEQKKQEYLAKCKELANLKYKGKDNNELMLHRAGRDELMVELRMYDAQIAEKIREQGVEYEALVDEKQKHIVLLDEIISKYLTQLNENPGDKEIRDKFTEEYMKAWKRKMKATGSKELTPEIIRSQTIVARNFIEKKRLAEISSQSDAETPQNSRRQRKRPKKKREKQRPHSTEGVSTESDKVSMNSNTDE